MTVVDKERFFMLENLSFLESKNLSEVRIRLYKSGAMLNKIVSQDSRTVFEIRTPISLMCCLISSTS